MFTLPSVRTQINRLCNAAFPVLTFDLSFAPSPESRVKTNILEIIYFANKRSLGKTNATLYVANKDESNSIMIFSCTKTFIAK